jgi:hypothetical protein
MSSSIFIKIGLGKIFLAGTGFKTPPDANGQLHDRGRQSTKNARKRFIDKMQRLNTQN